MNHQRLHALSDAVFAIAMTLLVLDIKVPVLKVANTHNLLVSLKDLIPTFLSFILSFAVLYTYWQGHSYVVSHVAKNIDATLSNLNALFLFFVVLIPFSAEFLGLYHNTEVAIALFGLNVLALSITLFYMKKYILKAETIENKELSVAEVRSTYIRMFFPSACAAAAIIVGLVNKDIPLALFTIGVLFNFTKLSNKLISELVN